MASTLSEDHVTLSVLAYYVTMMQRVVYPTIIIVGVVGNTLSFLVMSSPSNRGSVMSMYLKVLAVTDTCSLVMLLLPRWVANVWPDLLRDQGFGEMACQFLYFIPHIFYNTSIWQICIIAVDRFIVVRFPLKAAQWCTMRKARILLSINLVAHVIIYLPSGFRSAQQDGDGFFSQCIFLDSFAWYGPVFDPINAALDVFPPLGLLFILNIAIIINLRRHGAEFKDKELGNTKTRRKQERSMTIMLVVVATCLLVLLLPLTLDFIVWLSLGDLMFSHPNLRFFTFEIGFELGLMNNAANFFLYFASSSKFREDLKRLFNCRVEC